MPSRTPRTNLLQVVTSVAVVGAVATLGVQPAVAALTAAPEPDAPSAPSAPSNGTDPAGLERTAAASAGAANDADGLLLHDEATLHRASALVQRVEATPAAPGPMRRAELESAVEAVAGRAAAANAAARHAERLSAVADRDSRALEAVVGGDTVVPGTSGIDAIAASSTRASKPVKAVRFAQRQIGDPYRFAAAGPGAWDCSGLTMRSYSVNGVRVGGHGATAQYRYARSHHRLKSYGHRRVGDLIFYTDGGGDMYHVAIYAGHNRMIEAPYEGKDVREVAVRGYDRLGLVARPA